MKKEGIKMKKGMKRAIVGALVVCLLAGTAFANSYYLHANEESEEENVLKIEEGDLSSVSQNELTDMDLASVSMNGIVEELTYQDENVLVTVTSEVEGAIPKGATLSVTPILPDAADTQEQYAEVETQLETKAEGEAYDIAGFLAYDICFIDEDGNEIEPDGAVKVTMEYINATIPETVAEKTAETEEPVTVGVTVMHLEEDENGAVQEVVDMAQTDSEATTNVLENLETNEAQEVQKAEFITESFSTFTITWTVKDGIERFINVHIVNLNGKELFAEGTEKYKVPLTYGNTGVEISRDELVNRLEAQLGADKLKDVTVRGLLLDEYNLAQYNTLDDIANASVSKVSFNDTKKDYNNNPWYYEQGGWNEWASANKAFAKDSNFIPDVYLVCEKLTTVETLDTSGLITMRMIDYSRSGGDVLDRTDYSNDEYVDRDGDGEIKAEALNPPKTIEFVKSDGSSTVYQRTITNEVTGGPSLDTNSTSSNYHNGAIKPGMVAYKLQDGYPVTREVEWYGGARTKGISLEPLFTNSDSAVSYNDNVNKLFIKSIYDETGYYEYSSFENYAYLESNGKFTVYDQIGTTTDTSNTGQYYYMRGNFMPYNKIAAGAIAPQSQNVYDENGNRLSEDVDRYSENLYLTQGENNYYFGMYMEASFYQPQGGKAEHNGDYSDMIYEFNGDDDLWIYVDDVLLLDIGGIHDAHSGSINFSTGVISWTDCATREKPVTFTTTIKARFEKAGVFPDGSGWDDNKVDDYFSNNTLKNYTTHTMKMFYMERGDGASNLHMKFNLQVIPKRAVEVKKVLEGDTAERYNEKQFAFQLMVKPNGASGYELFNPENGKLITGVGERKDLTVGENSVFYLKNGETAQFTDLDENTDYYVVELDLDDEQFEKPKFDGAPGETDYQSYSKKVGERRSVTVTNTCITEDMAFVKQMAGKDENKQTSDDAFSFKVSMKETTDNDFKAYTGGYTITHEDKTEITGTVNPEDDGKITGVKVGDTVTIKGVLIGTQFNVEEVALDHKYVDQNPQLPIIGTDSKDGVVTITFTNEYKPSVKVSKVWNDVKAADEHDAIYVGLYVQTVETDGDGKSTTTVAPWTPGEKDVQSYGTLNKDNDWTHTFEYVPVLEQGKTYLVKELRSVKDNETAEFTIGGKSYVGVNEGDKVLLGDRTYVVDYSDTPTQVYGENNQSVEAHTITNTVVWQIVKRSTTDEGIKIKDAEFSLTKDGTVYNGISDENGVIQWSDVNGEAVTTILDGTYTLKETKAPTGYMLNTETWTINVIDGVPTVKSSTGESLTSTVEGNTVTFTFINEMMYELPATGGIGVYWYAAGGMLLLFAAMLLTYKSKCNGNPA